MSSIHQYGQDVYGILLLDKPKGVTSNYVLQKVKKIYNANRAGYAGILDPIASGLLPVCFGKATKFSRYLLDANKRYRVVAKLGQRTDTSDAYGKIIHERSISFNKEELDTTLESFRGNILQLPPMYSALKFRGKRLYKYARQGMEVPREPRPITIYELLCIYYEDTKLELEIHCSKGTYIRTIIDDLGEKLGCGAHVIYLRRTAVNGYSAENIVTLEYLQALVEQAHEKHVPETKLLYPLLISVDSLISNNSINLPLKSSSCIKDSNSIYTTPYPLDRTVRVNKSKEGKFTGINKVNIKGHVTFSHPIIQKLGTQNHVSL